MIKIRSEKRFYLVKSRNIQSYLAVVVVGGIKIIKSITLQLLIKTFKYLQSVSQGSGTDLNIKMPPVSLDSGRQ